MFEKSWNIIIAVLIIVLVIAYFCNNYEGFAGSLDAKNAEAISNVASIYNKDEVKVTNVSTNNLNVNGQMTLKTDKWHTSLEDGRARLLFMPNEKTYFGAVKGYEWRNNGDQPIMNLSNEGTLNVKNGSRFTGDRHWFQDAEGKGRLRVGAAWGYPGIYSEDGGNDLVLGSATGTVRLGPPGAPQTLCIGNTCITEGQLADLLNNTIKHGEDITIRSRRSGFMMQDRTSDRVGVFAGPYRGPGEQLAIEKCSMATDSGNPWKPRTCANWNN